MSCKRQLNVALTDRQEPCAQTQDKQRNTEQRQERLLGQDPDKKTATPWLVATA